MKLSVLVSMHLLCMSMFLNVSISEIFSGLSPKLLSEVEDTYESSNSFKSLLDDLSSQDVHLDFIHVKMQDVGYWYDMSSDGRRCTIYINEDLDFHVQDLSEILFVIYTSLHRDDRYLQTRQSKIESMIYAELVIYESGGESNLENSLFASSSEKSVKKYMERVRDMLYAGYDEDKLNYLVENSDIVPVFELNSTRFLEKKSIISDPVIEEFLKANTQVSESR